MSYVYLEKSDTYATLSTWLYCHLWLAYSANQMGRTPYIHWPQQANRFLLPHADPQKFAESPNMYEWWFEQPFCPEGALPPRDATWLWENCPESGTPHTNNLMIQPLAVIKEWYQKHLRFKPFIHERGQAILEKYKFDPVNTIAVSWRGCDSYTDGRPRMPIETYFPFIDDILEKEPYLRIFATAEETTVVDRILARYPNAFTITELFSAPWGYTGHSEFVNPASGFERGVQTCLMLWLLSRCKHYVKNRSSSGGVASWLSTGNIVCLAHPENLGFGFDLTKAEIKGQLYPLHR